MQGNTDVAYCQAASEPVAYRLVELITSWTLVIHAWVDWIWVFMNSNRWIGSCVPVVRQIITETGLIVCH